MRETTRLVDETQRLMVSLSPSASIENTFYREHILSETDGLFVSVCLFARVVYILCVCVCVCVYTHTHTHTHTYIHTYTHTHNIRTCQWARWSHCKRFKV